MATATTSRSRKVDQSTADVPVRVPVEPTADHSAAMEHIMDLVEQTAQQKLAAIREQKCQLAEAEKAVKATIPNLTPLDKLIARQAEQYTQTIPWHLSHRIAARMRVGQDREAATQQVLDFYMALVSQQVDALLAKADQLADE